MKNIPGSELAEKEFPENTPDKEAIDLEVQTALEKVEKRLNDPVDQVAEAVGQLSTKGQLKNIIKEHYQEQAKILWSDVKTIVIGAVTLIPIFGPSGELVDAAILEGATLTQAKVLAMGGKVTESGKIVYPLIKLLGKEGSEKLFNILKTLDPFEDVPGLIVAGSGIAGFFVEGAGTIPSILQFLINRYKSLKLVSTTGSKIGELVKDKINERLVKADSSEMQTAAQAFA